MSRRGTRYFMNLSKSVYVENVEIENVSVSSHTNKKACNYTFASQ